MRVLIAVRFVLLHVYAERNVEQRVLTGVRDDADDESGAC
jgi:hypothetical protein